MVRHLARLLGVAALAGCVACSPSLNWRVAQLERLTLLLPCKPDTAQRTVQLGAQTQPLDMKGCEAAGALFAVSRIHVQQGMQASQVVSAWRAASLINLRANASVEMPWVIPVSGAAGSMLEASGAGPNGAAVQARLVWLVAGDDVFHIAVYATHLTPELIDPLLSEIKVR
jgi:hypothetical protein